MDADYGDDLDGGWGTKNLTRILAGRRRPSRLVSGLLTFGLFVIYKLWIHHFTFFFAKWFC